MLGKLLARLLSTGMLLIVGLPILAIAALLGGINFEQLAGVFVITLSTMVAVATLGIAVSVTSPRVRDAIGRAYVLLLALLCLPAVIEGLLQWSGYFGELGYWNEWLMKGNPLVAFLSRWLSLECVGQDRRCGRAWAIWCWYRAFFSSSWRYLPRPACGGCTWRP